jgi:adenine-specific DNA-methyltransferase
MNTPLGETLESVLRKDERLVSQDGMLLKNKIQELVGSDDLLLLESIYENLALRKHFFLDLKKTSVFNKEKFLLFVSAKEWLPNSYTAYKNRVGLTVNEKFVNDSSDVVLDWAFKDCILEGGMKEEESNRQEVFYNEVIAPDEQNRLLEPKAFSNPLRISAKGEEPLKSFKTDENGIPSDNLIIRGNNLLGLASIADVYTRRVKLIYIDPPYNRDAESFYNDSFKRSTWLTFMKNRLEIAKRLLKPDGVICIQIDETQFAYLKVLADEVFRQNHLNTVVIKMSEASGVKMSHVEKRLPKVKEYLLIYAKDLESIRINPIKIEKKFNAQNDNYLKYYSQIIENPGAEVEDWKIVPLKEYVARNNISFTNKEEEIAFKLKHAERMVYRTNNSELSKLEFETSLKRVKSATGLEYIWWEGKQLLKLSDYLTEGLVDLWTDVSTINLNKEGGVDFPNGKKPEALLQRIIDLFTAPDDLVLDYHLGSGTTAAVAHKMKRRYIGIEQINYLENDATHRLKNVIAGDSSGVSKAVGWKGGGDFVYLELAERNPKFLKSIGEAKTNKELLAIWDDLAATSFLSYKVDIKKFNQAASDFVELSLEDARSVLFEVVDKNAIYVNVSEIHDKSNGLSIEEVNVTKSFYGVS